MKNLQDVTLYPNNKPLCRRRNHLLRRDICVRFSVKVKARVGVRVRIKDRVRARIKVKIRGDQLTAPTDVVEASFY